MSDVISVANSDVFFDEIQPSRFHRLGISTCIFWEKFCELRNLGIFWAIAFFGMNLGEVVVMRFLLIDVKIRL